MDSDYVVSSIQALLMSWSLIVFRPSATACCPAVCPRRWTRLDRCCAASPNAGPPIRHPWEPSI